MENEVYDYCIIGAGLVGSLLAYNLTKNGKRVVIIDAGPRFVDQQAEYGFNSKGILPYVLPEGHPSFLQYEDSSTHPYPYEQSIVKGIGGSTLAWLGIAIRLLPDDFKMYSKFGIGVDWPINYSNLEEYYQEAECELGVAGKNDNPWLKNIIYPLPAFLFDETDQIFTRACTELNIRTHSTSQARNSRKYRNYPECDSSASCITFCPSGAKYTALRHLLEAEKTGFLKIIPNAPVLRLVSDKDKILSALVFNSKKPFHIKAQNFILAAHTVESIRLLMLSKNDFFPNGLANSSGLLGKYFMDHPAIISEGEIDLRLDQKGYQTLQSYQFYSTENRSREGAIKLEFSTSPQFIWQKKENESVKKLKILSLLDVLPSLENQVSLSKIKNDNLHLPVAKISIKLSEYENQAVLKAKSIAKSILQNCGARIIESSNVTWGMGHPSGGCRMSKSKSEGVVDENLKAHDISNLFVVGSSVFPTIGAANPSLTIAALALKLSHHLIDNY
jgi:glucose dehydrogenase